MDILRSCHQSGETRARAESANTPCHIARHNGGSLYQTMSCADTRPGPKGKRVEDRITRLCHDAEPRDALQGHPERAAV